MQLREFNNRFLAALERTPGPRLRRSILRECQEDIKIDSLQAAIGKWSYFIGLNPSITDIGPLPPSPVMGLQLDFGGRTGGKGRQYRLGLTQASPSQNLRG